MILSKASTYISTNVLLDFLCMPTQRPIQGRALYNAKTYFEMRMP